MSLYCLSKREVTDSRGEILDSSEVIAVFDTEERAAKYLDEEFVESYYAKKSDLEIVKVDYIK